MVKKKKVPVKEDSSVSSSGSSSTYSSNGGPLMRSPNRSQNSRMSLDSFIESNTPAKTKKARAYTGAAVPATPKKTKKKGEVAATPKKKKKVGDTPSPKKKTKETKAAAATGEGPAASPTKKKKATKATAGNGEAAVASPTKKKKQATSVAAAKESPTKAKQAGAVKKKATTPKTPKKVKKKTAKEIEAQALGISTTPTKKKTTKETEVKALGTTKTPKKKTAKQIKEQALGLAPTVTPKKKKVVKKKTVVESDSSSESEQEPSAKAASLRKTKPVFAEETLSSSEESGPIFSQRAKAKTLRQLVKQKAVVEDDSSSSSSSEESELVPAHHRKSIGSVPPNKTPTSPRRHSLYEADHDSTSSSGEEIPPASPKKSIPTSPKRNPLSPKRSPIARKDSTSSSSSSSSSGYGSEKYQPQSTNRSKLQRMGSNSASSCNSSDNDVPQSRKMQKLNPEEELSRTHERVIEKEIVQSPVANPDTDSSNKRTTVSSSLTRSPLRRMESSSSSSNSSSDDETADLTALPRSNLINQESNDDSDSSLDKSRPNQKPAHSLQSIESMESEAPISLSLRPGGVVRPQAPLSVNSGISTDSEPPLHLGLRPGMAQKAVSDSSSSSDSASSPPISLGLRPRGLTRCLSDSTIDTTPPISLSLRPGTNTVTTKEANRVESPKRLLRNDSDESVLDPYVDGEYFLSTYESQRRHIAKRRPPNRFATKSLENITSLKDRIQNLGPKKEVKPLMPPPSFVSPVRTAPCEDATKKKNSAKKPSLVQEKHSPQRRTSTYDGERSQPFLSLRRKFKKAVNETDSEESEESDNAMDIVTGGNIAEPNSLQNGEFDGEQSMTFRALQRKLKRAVNEEVSDDDTVEQGTEEYVVEGQSGYDGEESMTFRELTPAKKSGQDSMDNNNNNSASLDPQDSFAARMFVPKKVHPKQEIPTGFSSRFQELKKQAMKIAHEIASDDEASTEERFARSPATRRHSTCGAQGMRYIASLPPRGQEKELLYPTSSDTNPADDAEASSTRKNDPTEGSPRRRHSALITTRLHQVPPTTAEEDSNSKPTPHAVNMKDTLSSHAVVGKKVRSPPKRAASKSLANVGSLQDRIKTLSFMAGPKPMAPSAPPKKMPGIEESAARPPVARSVSKTLEHVVPIKDRLKFLNLAKDDTEKEEKRAPNRNISMLPAPSPNRKQNGHGRLSCLRRASLDNSSIAEMKLSPAKEPLLSRNAGALVSPRKRLPPGTWGTGKPSSSIGALVSPHKIDANHRLGYFDDSEAFSVVDENEKEEIESDKDSSSHVDSSSHDDDSLETLQKEASTLRHELNRVHEHAEPERNDSSSSSSSGSNCSSSGNDNSDEDLRQGYRTKNMGIGTKNSVHYNNI